MVLFNNPYYINDKERSHINYLGKSVSKDLYSVKIENVFGGIIYHSLHSK